ncbi:MAG: Crp/Fnr family transcriptional regulator [Candidatus Sedimenticola sp. (ex Thyasira tokunagai)]
MALVVEGSARVYKIGENGREITLYRVGFGESCILTASCILSGIPFPAFAVAETPVTAFVIPASKVRVWLAEWSAWREYVFSLVAQRLTNPHVSPSIRFDAFLTHTKQVRSKIGMYILSKVVF